MLSIQTLTLAMPSNSNLVENSIETLIFKASPILSHHSFGCKGKAVSLFPCHFCILLCSTLKNTFSIFEFHLKSPNGRVILCTLTRTTKQNHISRFFFADSQLFSEAQSKIMFRSAWSRQTITECTHKKSTTKYYEKFVSSVLICLSRQSRAEFEVLDLLPYTFGSFARNQLARSLAARGKCVAISHGSHSRRVDQKFAYTSGGDVMCLRFALNFFAYYHLLPYIICTYILAEWLMRKCFLQKMSWKKTFRAINNDVWIVNKPPFQFGLATAKWQQICFYGCKMLASKKMKCCNQRCNTASYSLPSSIHPLTANWMLAHPQVPAICSFHTSFHRSFAIFKIHEPFLGYEILFATYDFERCHERFFFLWLKWISS